MNNIFYFLVFIYPFTLLINSAFPAKILNISIMNFIYIPVYIFMFLIIIYKNSNSMTNSFSKFVWIVLYSACFFYSLLLVKFYQVNDATTVMNWLVKNNYYVSMYIVGLYIYTFKIKLSKLLKTVYFSSLLVAILGLLFFFSHNYFGIVDQSVILTYWIVGSSYARLMSVFGNPNVAAYYYLIVIIFLIGNMKNLLHSFNKFVVMISFLLLGISFFLTLCRSAFLSALIVFLIYIVRNFINKKFISNIITMMIILIGSLSFFYFNGNHLYFFSKNYFINDPRMMKWTSGLLYFIQNPFFGPSLDQDITFGTFETTFSDNEFLKDLIHFGIIGYFPLVVLLICLIRNNIYQIKIKNPARFTILNITIIFLYGCFFNNFLEFFPVNLYIVMFLVVLSQRFSNPMSGKFGGIRIE